MARITEEQRGRLVQHTGLRSTAKAMGINTDGMSRNDKALMDHIDSVPAKRIESFKSPLHTNPSVLPAMVPPTREESGLVDLNMVLDESQRRAMANLHDSKHGCLIGAAGTGKTTMIQRHIANLIYGGDGAEPVGVRDMGGGRLSIAFCAFTGRAMQQIKSVLPPWLHGSCFTIHSLLEYVPVGDTGDGESRMMFEPSRNATNPLDQNFIVVDETSMVGLDLWHNLMDACRLGTRLLLIGDLNQLPPVADSHFFPLALDAGYNRLHDYGLSELTTIHRQVGPGANRIIDTAHSILNGKRPQFDIELKVVVEKGKMRLAQCDAKGRVVPKDQEVEVSDWRVLHIHLPVDSEAAHKHIVGITNQMRQMKLPDEDRVVFDPYSDLLLTSGNGWDNESKGFLIEQAPLNESLAALITPGTKDNPTYLIDAGRESRKYTVGDRVMAIKNESPAVKNRVTNGTTGVIRSIKPNGNWNGDRKRFGAESDVRAYEEEVLAAFESGDDGIEGFDLEAFAAELQDAGPEFGREDFERQASHIIEIEYEGGELRVYGTAAGVASTRLAYAMTVHKAQGSQADTVFIVAHGAVKGRLSREWFYTGVTRARKRVVVFSTDAGMAYAVNRQQVVGRTLAEKIANYSVKVKKAGKFIKLTPEG